MALEIYRGDPPTSSTQLDRVDLIVGDGGATYPVTEKTAFQIGTIIQSDTSRYFYYNGGFTIDTDENEFTLSQDQEEGAEIVVPGVKSLVFEAYDQEVEGETDPRVSVQDFYIFDPSSIHLNTYKNKPGDPGIKLSFYDAVTGSGPDTSWVQLACTDVNGNALTYAATGTAIYTANISTFDALTSSCIAGDTILAVNNGNQFILGDYIIISIGSVDAEIRKIIAKTASSITLSLGTTSAHSTGESILTCGRRFKAKCTVPVDATGGEAGVFLDLILRVEAIKETRI